MISCLVSGFLQSCHALISFPGLYPALLGIFRAISHFITIFPIYTPSYHNITTGSKGIFLLTPVWNVWQVLFLGNIFSDIERDSNYNNDTLCNILIVGIHTQVLQTGL